MRTRFLIDCSSQTTKAVNPPPDEHYNHILEFGMASKNLLSRLPPWLSRWLGHRPSLPPASPAPIFIYFWSFIGAFIGISIIQAIFEQSSYFQARHVPSIVASYVRLSTHMAFRHRLSLTLPSLGTDLRLI